MGSDWTYRITDAAERDLDETLEYMTAVLQSPTAAKSFFQKVFTAMERLLAFPNSGALVGNELVADASVRKVFVDNYILYYKAVETEKTVYLLRIVYGRRSLDEILRSFPALM